jgi:hypothetical protein
MWNSIEKLVLWQRAVQWHIVSLKNQASCQRFDLFLWIAFFRFWILVDRIFGSHSGPQEEILNTQFLGNQTKIAFTFEFDMHPSLGLSELGDFHWWLQVILKIPSFITSDCTLVHIVIVSISVKMIWTNFFLPQFLIIIQYFRTIFIWTSASYFKLSTHTSCTVLFHVFKCPPIN